ncbi:LVIVD repeat-containing protein [Nocardiopsis changdeensis]|uniref:LVIVD repeat-containing protein n=1 Tax=Nocardiopsis changdeensis TaxID=2831969 RepID=UPI003F45E1FC
MASSPMPTPPPRSWRSTLKRGAVALTGATVLVASLLAPSAASADPAFTSDAETSANVTHIANVPKTEVMSDFNSDLAFTGDYAIGGNYNGFVIYDISTPESPTVVSEVLCPGGQGDVSVSGDLLYFSVDYARASDECGAPSVPTSDPNGFEGIRIFDISDKENPQYVAAVRTDCGSHTNTLVPGKDGEHEYIYVSSYSPSANFPNCQPPHDKISIIEVPIDDPASAQVIDAPVLFPEGGYRNTSGCHDITVYPKHDIAAGACMGDGILMDISDPAAPVVTDVVQDTNFAFWHSATFTNDGATVMFTDELGGGGGATCLESIGSERGANAIYTIDGFKKGEPELSFEGYFKIPRMQGSTENCVAHNGSLIPVPGRDFFVQSWYQGGVSVIDFNDPSDPQEIGYFDRGPIDDDRLVLGGSWSAYYYNGYVYSSDITRGLDVIKLEDPRFRVAEQVHMSEFNPQSQPEYRPGRGNGR